MMIRSILKLLLLFYTTIVWGVAERGPMVRVNTSTGQAVEMYGGGSHALVIGIDTYQNLSTLSNGVADAEAIAAVLQQHGFEVSLKRNPDAVALKQAFEDFFIEKGVNPDARLFVWFAGHGTTWNGEGYLLPVDAPLPNRLIEFRKKALSLRRFGEYMRQADAKHVYAVFDACFAGTIFETARDGIPPPISAATTRPVRQFLTSGDAGQKVSDNGRFRKLFVEALSGARPKADYERDGYLTASELGMFMTNRITSYTEKRQTPRYGKLRDPNYDLGDFVFQLMPTKVGVEREQLLEQVAQAESALKQQQTDREALEETLVLQQQLERLKQQQAEEFLRQRRLQQQLKAVNKPNKEATKAKTAPSLPYEPEMVEVSGGRYQMGDLFGDGYSNEKAHWVEVGDFRIGKYEVTQEQWGALMGKNPSRFKGCDHCPVEQVSWNEVEEYINKLNKKTGKSYRLPTEAEWEYAARSGGKKERYSGGEDVDALAWYAGNSKKKTHPVGEKGANGLGLHDMSGNVYEWTSSEYASQYDGSSELKRSSAGRASGQRVVRGGSWYYVPRFVRAAYRSTWSPDDRNSYLGFRLAQDL
jgi:formylglycine-generating enzyme required for sulfatase activity